MSDSPECEGYFFSFGFFCEATDFLFLFFFSSARMMSDCIKIGEGVYGEVFKSFSKGKPIALKVRLEQKS